jgi:hypothetical protein
MWTHHFLHRSANASRSTWTRDGVAERGCGLALPLAGLLFAERPEKPGEAGETSSRFGVGGERGAVEGRS